MAFVQSILATPFGAFAGLLATMVIGELVSKLTKGIVPQALATTFLLMGGFWSGLFPTNIVETAGISANLFSIVAGILVVNLGTLISAKQMAAQWRTVVIALSGIVAIIVVCMTIGTALFGLSNAAAAAPPLTGAAMATAMVRQAAEAAGNIEALTVAIVCMSLQSIVGYPLVSLCLKKEARRLVKEYRAGNFTAAAAAEAKAYKADGKRESTNMTLLKLTLLTIVAMFIQTLTETLGFSISMYVWALILGFIGHEIGFLQTDCLTKANTYGMCITVLMLYLFGGLSSSTPEQLFSAFGVGITLIALCTLGMAGLGFLVGKALKRSFWLSFAITLNAYLGFPINVILTNEALDLNTEEGEERAIISGELMPPMLVGSFVCVTIVSVIVAGVLIKYI